MCFKAGLIDRFHCDNLPHIVKQHALPLGQWTLYFLLDNIIVKKLGYLILQK